MECPVVQHSSLSTIWLDWQSSELNAAFCGGLEVIMDRYRILVKGVVQYEDKYLVVRKWYDDRVSEPYQWEFIDGEIDEATYTDKKNVITQ